MTLYVVYHNPDDYPGEYVVRRQVAGPGTVTIDPTPLYTGPSLDEAQSYIPAGLVRLPRDPNDVPSIVEVWI